MIKKYLAIGVLYREVSVVFEDDGMLGLHDQAHSELQTECMADANDEIRDVEISELTETNGTGEVE